MQLSDKTIEFTFEAAESDIVGTAFDFFTGAYLFKNINTDKPEEEMTEDEKLKAKVAQTDAMITGISTMPKLAIDFLYMGLLEHHGVCGDISQDIKTRNDAKAFYKKFCKENPDDVCATQFGLFEALKGQMETDGFFKRIGLEQFMEAQNAAMEKTVKMPQDHKKKSTKA